MKRYIMILFFIAGIPFTASPQPESKEIREIDVERLIYSLNFDNDGVKESAINYAGKYRVIETLSSLSNILLNDDNEKLRLLAANAMINFGGKDILKKLQFAARFDNSSIVRNTCSALIRNYDSQIPGRKINYIRTPENILGLKDLKPLISWPRKITPPERLRE